MKPIIPLEYFLLIGLGLLALTGLVSWYSTRRIPSVWRVLITISRIMGLTGILLLILNFGYERERFAELESSWAIMIDNSSSMTFQDAPSGSRWETAQEIATDALALSTDEEKVIIHAFSDSAKSIKNEDLATIVPDGKSTRIIEAGQNMLIQEKSKGTNLRGVLLLSDGRLTIDRPPDSFALRAAAQGIPIYPVILGGEVPSKDLELDIPHRKLVSFKNQPVTFKGVLANHRMGPQKTDIELLDADGNVLETVEILTNDSQRISFKFDLAHSKPGYYEYLVRTQLREGESDRANNTVSIGLFVMSDRLNVLLLEGEPYWDTKFLSHLLRAQTNISMTAIFRVAKDKFFKVSTDTDMTSSDTDVFPLTDAELAQYDLVVLGKGTEYFIDQERAERLTEFVKNRGGCLFFARGKSYESENSFLQELEPVSWGTKPHSQFMLQPMLAGEQVGLFGGLLPARDERLWKDLPVLTSGYECKKLKSFASVLAGGIAQSSLEDQFPLLISRRYGAGLILLINGDGLWKWGFFPEISDDSALYQNLWIQMFQWAISFAEFNPGSDYIIRADQANIHINNPLRIRVRARAHVKKEDIAISIYKNDQRIQNMVLDNTTGQNDEWNGSVILTNPGVYRLAVETRDNKDLGAQTSIQVLPPPGEQDNLSADRIFLEELATKSGGRIITREDLPDLIKQLETPKTTLRKGDVIWETLWDRAWVCVMIMVFFALEWYARRRQGLH